ncbi:MAG: glycosyltransferase family 2 protein [Alistipes sp.]|nr:glycosyltransferase family 2 protein [Alistipes sp.]
MMSGQNNIIAVVVTYNRLSLLKGCIEALRRQTVAVSEIVVVNNGSTDGTGEWLAGENSLTVINQENVGGAGGFHTGMKFAFERGIYDWIWVMDDDVSPADDCLERLLDHRNDDDKVAILQPGRKQSETGEWSLMFWKRLNMTNPFKVVLRDRITEEDLKAPCYVQTIPFEGPLICRSLIEEIGLPNKEFFIFCDDTDFVYRSTLAGYRTLLIPEAILWRHIMPPASEDEFLSWRIMYKLRNTAYFDRVYGKNWAVRNLRPFNKMLKHIKRGILGRKKGFTLRKAAIFVKYYMKGMRGQLGKVDL